MPPTLAEGPEGYTIEPCRNNCCAPHGRWSFRSPRSPESKACGFASEEEAVTAAWLDRGRVAAGRVVGLGLGKLGSAISWLGRAAGAARGITEAAADAGCGCDCHTRESPVARGQHCEVCLPL